MMAEMKVLLVDSDQKLRGELAVKIGRAHV